MILLRRALLWFSYSNAHEKSQPPSPFEQLFHHLSELLKPQIASV